MYFHPSYMLARCQSIQFQFNNQAKNHAATCSDQALLTKNVDHMLQFYFWSTAVDAGIVSRITGFDIGDNQRVVMSTIGNSWILGPLLDFVHKQKCTVFLPYDSEDIQIMSCNNIMVTELLT
jgi:hypothetical protein